jgi:hypothetical protein
VNRELNSNVNVKEVYELDSTGSRQVPAAGKETSGSIKVEEFTDQVSDYQL